MAAINAVEKLKEPMRSDPIIDSGRINEYEPVGSPLYNEILGFLHHEAWLLDHDLFKEWHATLAEDIVYTAPVIVTRSRSQNNRSIVGRTGFHYYDNHSALAVRIRRILDTGNCWSDDPPLRCRRTISNVMVGPSEVEGEYHVRSYFQLARNRFEWSEYQWITGERNDIFRRNGDSFLVAKREILVDTSTLGTPNMAMFF